MTQDQLISVWKLFKKFPKELNGFRRYPWELGLFKDGSGHVLDEDDLPVVEWDNYEEAVINLSSYLEQFDKR